MARTCLSYVALPRLACLRTDGGSTCMNVYAGGKGGFEEDSRGAGSSRCVWRAGRRGVARVEWREFCGWGARDFGGAWWGGGGGKRNCGGVAALAAGEWGNHRRGGFA